MGSEREEKFLQEMRSVGDQSADDAVEVWLGRDQARSVRALADALVGVDLPPELPELLEFLQPVHGPDLVFDLQEEALAEHLFAEHGLKILMILAFYSLPAAYAAARGVPVLNKRSGSTGVFVEDVNRRLIETTQFVLEVLTAIKPSQTPRRGTPPCDRAVASARRVRLLHAAVRKMILGHENPSWDLEKRGVPVNQEDMAGTFLTFSWVVIDGLRKLRVDMSPAQERVFYNIWKRFAPTLGLDPRLIPANVEEAEHLTKLIRARQVDGPIQDGVVNRDGKEMAAALLDFLRSSLPWPLRLFRRLPASVMRFFLPTEPTDVASSIGIPRTYGLDELVRLWLLFEATITRFRIFDAANRLIFKEWGRRDDRANALFQFSRFFMRRYVDDLSKRDRTQHLKIKGKRARAMDLLGWDERWQFDQASFLTRGAFLAADKFRPRRTDR